LLFIFVAYAAPYFMMGQQYEGGGFVHRRGSDASAMGRTGRDLDGISRIPGEDTVSEP